MSKAFTKRATAPGGSRIRRQHAKSAIDPKALEQYPFLKAALENLEEVQRCASGESTNRRHVVCLMFDALEFTLYEVLLLHDRDIYRTGQNTIGFDDALDECTKLGVEIPLIGTVRQIQKHRGDAKHHAQSPDDSAYQRLLGNFEIIVSRLVYEQFENVLGDALAALPLLSHRVALFESYRRRRNHHWEQAYRFILGALLRKHREMFGNRSALAFTFDAGHAYQLDVLEKEIDGTDYRVAPTEAASALKKLVSQIRKLLADDQWERAASLVGVAFSTTDKLLPGIFDVDRAKRLTSLLYQPAGFHYGRPMAWAKVWGRPGSAEAELAGTIKEFLKSNGDVVKKFGQPHYADDDDRYWRWWEFAIFNGDRWHTFHIDALCFQVSLEVGPDSSSDRTASADLLTLILQEICACKDTSKT